MTTTTTTTAAPDAAPPSARARHTKLALSKALNVTITRAPLQASLRKMLARSKTAKRRLSGGGSELADPSELLPGLLDAADGATSRADDALAQVVLGVCEDVEVLVDLGLMRVIILKGPDGTSCNAMQTHFEALAEETFVNGDFANLDTWIQEAQENVLRKRARSDRCVTTLTHFIAVRSRLLNRRFMYNIVSEHKADDDDDDDDNATKDADALSPEMLVLAERQRVVDDELRALHKLREQKAAQLAQVLKSVELARRAAVLDVEKAQSAVAQVDDVRHLVKDYAAA